MPRSPASVGAGLVDEAGVARVRFDALRAAGSYVVDYE